MLKLFIPLFSFFILAGINTTAGIKLTAIPDTRASAILLQWNMVNFATVTAYVLLKSNDGVVWQIAAANPAYRNYSSSSILIYKDEIINEEKLYYKVRVYDVHDNTVAMSNTAIAQIHKTIYRGGENNKANSTLNSNTNETSYNKTWQLYPNPVNDLLSLSYKKSDKAKGVINVIITDVTSKVVVRFRQASNNMQLHIPVSNLRAGLYFIKINVLNETQMNEKFIKQ